MTRVNVIPVDDLTDQHLLAEWREIPRIITQAAKALESGREVKIPDTYRMGTGHCLFFYNKTAWIADRHAALTKELVKRGYNLSTREPLRPLPVNVAWIPDSVAYEVNLKRLREKLADPPGQDFYTCWGIPVPADWYGGSPC